MNKIALSDMRMLLAVAVLGLFLVLPNTSHAACTFTKDLQLGTMSEEVKCLQQYLNGAGYTVATEGVGSKGKETTEFKTLTQKAVIRW